LLGLVRLAFDFLGFLLLIAKNLANPAPVSVKRSVTCGF